MTIYLHNLLPNKLSPSLTILFSIYQYQWVSSTITSNILMESKYIKILVKIPFHRTLYAWQNTIITHLRTLQNREFRLGYGMRRESHLKWFETTSVDANLIYLLLYISNKTFVKMYLINAFKTLYQMWFWIRCFYVNKSSFLLFIT